MSDHPPKDIQIDSKDESSAKTPPPHQQDKTLPPALAQKIIKPLDKNKPQYMPKKLAGTILAALIITSAGVSTGYAMSRVFSLKKSSINKTSQQVADEGIKIGDVIGSADESTFKDSAEGVLVKGGVDGEGSHHLLRPGGVSQNVYLTSSVLDLDKLDGAKVKVWGETFAAQKAGWLMDVGRAQVLELNAEKPFDEATPLPAAGDE